MFVCPTVSEQISLMVVAILVNVKTYHINDLCEGEDKSDAEGGVVLSAGTHGHLVPIQDICVQVVLTTQTYNIIYYTLC